MTWLPARAGSRWLLAILIVALTLRIVWVSTVQPDPRDGRFDDSVWYYGTTHNLLEGHGYVVPGDVFCGLGPGIGCDEHPPTAMWTPGFALVLAPFFALPGDDVAAGRALNLFAALALVVGVYSLGRRLFDERAGLIAAGIVALFPSLIFFSTLLLGETLFMALAIGLLCLAAAWTLDSEPARRKVLLIGLATGAMAMVRPESVVLAAIIVLTWVALRRPWRVVARHAGLLVLGILVFVAPWTIRNVIQIDAPIAGTTGFGQVLIQAHHPAATGSPNIFIVSELTNRFQDVPRPEREIRINNAGTREALEYMVKHPRRELRLVPDRFAAFYRSDRGAMDWVQREDGAGRRALSNGWAERWGLSSDIYYYTVLAAAVLALPLWVRRAGAQHLLIAGPIAVYSAMWAFLFVGEARYHLPLLPMFAVLAGIGLAALWQRIAAARG